MMNDWSVREANADDAASLALIGSSTFLETFAGILAGDAIVTHCERSHSSKAYSGYLGNGSRAWLAELSPGKAPIGFALTGQPDLPSARDGDIELKRIYLLSRFHGIGLGAELMRQAIKAAQGSPRLLLGVYAGNDRAQAFYRKNGFEQIDTRRFDVGGVFYDDIVFARNITV
jgi:diamine N-acetyltransferase